MKTSEVLNRAADVIEERGWTWGTGWTDRDGQPLCLEGAIRAAMGQKGVGVLRNCPAGAAVRDYLGEVPWIWNDDLPFDDEGWVGGSKETAEKYGAEQVIATLRAAAVIEAAKESADERVVQPETVASK